MKNILVDTAMRTIFGTGDNPGPKEKDEERPMPPFLTSFEDYLPLLIVIALWWLMVKRETAPRPQPPKRVSRGEAHAGGQFNLRETLRRLLNGAEEGPRPVERLTQPGRPPASGAGGGTRFSLVEKRQRSQTADEKPFGKPARPLPVYPVVAPGRRPPSASSQASPRPFATRIVRPGNLREAVVWSAFLGPPAGLREV